MRKQIVFRKKDKKQIRSLRPLAFRRSIFFPPSFPGACVRNDGDSPLRMEMFMPFLRYCGKLVLVNTFL